MPSNEAEWAADPLPAAPEVADDPLAPVREVAERLLGGGLYTRTALLLLPHTWLGREGVLAARLGVSHVNYQTWKLVQVPQEQQFLMYSDSRLLSELDALCAERHTHGTLLVSLLDLPLAALPPDLRRAFWMFLFSSFNKRPRALLFALPYGAQDILPDSDTQERWRAAGRLAVLHD